MIAIVDYGSGNIRAIERLCQLSDIACQRLSEPEAISRSTSIILPGVGAIDTVMASLHESGVADAILAAVASGRTMLLGICVGMHALARRSAEGEADCLSLIDGDVERFDPAMVEVPAKLPHMGWNSLTMPAPHPVLDGVDLDRGFYFLHSFRYANTTPDEVVATADHGGAFPAIVGKDNVLGVQFHPEKSHGNGVRLIKNFSELRPC